MAGNIFDLLKANAGGVSAGLSLGASIGQGINEFRGSESVQREQQATREAFSELNARRVAREARYRQGQAVTANASAGHGQFGSFIFAAANNARAAEERRQEQLLRAKFSETDVPKLSPLGLTSRILGASARFAANTFEGDN